MTLPPKPFRERPRVTAIEDADVFPLSRMVNGVGITYSITWSSMSAQVIQEVIEARQASVAAFTAAQADLALAVQMIQQEIDAVEAAMAQSVVGVAHTADMNAAMAAAIASEVSARNSAISSSVNTEAAIRSLADTTEGQARIAADALKLQLYNAGVSVSAPKIHVAAKTLTAAGSAVIYLTSDGTSSGSAIFGAAVLNVQPVVNDAATLYTFSWTVSTDRKTLTMTVNKSATPLLSLLGVNILAAPAAAPVGTAIQVLVTGY